jgi:hypothetical protein
MIVLTELNNIVNEMGIYRIALIMKSVLNITLTIVPIIVIILSMVDISKIVFYPNSMKENFKKPVNRIIAGLIVFLIPTIIDTSFSLIESYDNSTILTYYNNAIAKAKTELVIAGIGSAFNTVNAGRTNVSGWGYSNQTRYYYNAKIYSYADASLAKEELGWETTKTIEDMCKDAYNFVIKNK